MFDTVEHVLSANVADNGTFTVGYPSGRTAGSYAGGYRHVMTALGAVRFAPENFTVSFGASDITVTYLDSTTLPAGSTVRLQFERIGDNSRHPETVVVDESMVPTPLYRINLGAPATADADGILNDASATDSAQAYDSSDFVAAFAARDGYLDVPRNLVATGTSGSDHVITITGQDMYGETMKESITLSGTGAIAGKKAFARVTAVDVAVGAAGDTFDLGWGDVLGLPVRVAGVTQIVHELQDNVVVSSRNSLQLVQVTSPSLADAGQVYAVCPRACDIVDAWAVTNTAVATADATITVKTAAGTVGTITVALSGSAVGVVDQISAVANAAVAAGGTIEFENDGAASAGVVDYAALVRPKNGEFVAAVDSAATATTGDTRGTYDPLTACDGTTSFALIVALPDPGDRGVDQFAG